MYPEKAVETRCVFEVRQSAAHGVNALPSILLPRARSARGRVISLSVRISVCVFVCLSVAQK